MRLRGCRSSCSVGLVGRTWPRASVDGEAECRNELVSRREAGCCSNAPRRVADRSLRSRSSDARSPSDVDDMDDVDDVDDEERWCRVPVSRTDMVAHSLRHEQIRVRQLSSTGTPLDRRVSCPRSVCALVSASWVQSVSCGCPVHVVSKSYWCPVATLCMSHARLMDDHSEDDVERRANDALGRQQRRGSEHPKTDKLCRQGYYASEGGAEA